MCDHMGNFLCVLVCSGEVGVIVRVGDGISLLDKVKILAYNRVVKRTERKTTDVLQIYKVIKGGMRVCGSLRFI